MGPLRSVAWDYFVERDTERKTARCSRCRRVLSYGSGVSNLTKHQRRCNGQLQRSRSPSQIKLKTIVVREYFTKPSESEVSATCNLCQETVSAESEGTFLEHLRTKHQDVELLDDDGLNDVSGRDRLEESDSPARVAKARKYFSKGEGATSAVCRLCSDVVPYDGSALLEHLLTLHAEEPLEEVRQGVGDVKIETLYVDEFEEARDKRRAGGGRAERDRRGREGAAEGEDSLELFSRYLLALLRELPAAKARKLQVEFLVQAHKTRLALDRRSRRSASSSSSESV